MALKKDSRRLRIRRGIRSKVKGTPEKPRLSVFRSNTSIVAQLIDDVNGKTLAYTSSKQLSDAKSVNIALSTEVGKKIAEKATEANINTVVFDRGGYLYHGRVKALAESAREAGLKF